MWQKVHHYSHSVMARAELFSEIRRAERLGLPLPKGLRTAVAKDPGACDEFLRLLRFVDPRRPVTLIDVGGNTGYWAEEFRAYFPHTTVVAFEPIPEVSSEYRQRFAGDSRVTVHQVALSDRIGESAFNVAHSTGRSSLHSYSASQDALDINFARTESVALDVLDNYAIPRVTGGQTVLKIDVQGHEAPVLRGGRTALKETDVAFVECSFAREYEGVQPHFAELASVLGEYDLHPAVFRDHGRSLSPYAWERDVVFVRSGLLDNLWGW